MPETMPNPASHAAEELPLHGVRMLDLTDGKGELSTRMLADLGADVVRVEWDPQSASRTHQPVVNGISAHHEAFNANKRSLKLDLTTAAGRKQFDSLLPNVDIVFTSFEPKRQRELDLEPSRLRQRNPHLVVVSLTHFGLTGPWSDWQGTESIHLALSAALARSGAVDRAPLLPPLQLALQSAALQAAWATMAAYSARLVDGEGDAIDISVFEAVVQTFDPGFGMAGSAAGGIPAADGPRGRVDFSFRYPFFNVADGVVRMAILSPRQWAGMFEWLGRPEAFTGDEWKSLQVRFSRSPELHCAIQRHLEKMTRAEVLEAASRYGIPAAPVLQPNEVMEEEHYRARGSFRMIEVDGRSIPIADGFVEFDDRRAGIRHRAPSLGAHTQEVLREFAAPAANSPSAAEPAAFGSAPSTQPALPFAGLRVVDFGVIVAGGEGGRLFADLGAEVIKIENLTVPDGSRQSMAGDAMSVLFAWGNRNKKSFGIDVKSPEGNALIRELLRTADVLLSNFKPGTLRSLGLTYEQLVEINPSIIVVESSAYGHTGPWSTSPGYGPIVRAVVGVSGLWRYHDDRSRFFDDVTIYPDHSAARAMAVAVAAKLIQRRRTNLGGAINLAQTEVALTQIAPVFAAEALQPGTTIAVGNIGPGDAPRGVWPGAGDDEWLVVDVNSDAHFQGLASVLGLDAHDPRFQDATSRVTHRAELDSSVAAWSSSRHPAAAMRELQAAGVPSAQMLRLPELLTNEQLASRRAFQMERHPLVEREMPSEGLPGRFERMPAVRVTPAPVIGEHTRQIAESVLGLEQDEIERLIASGILQEDERALRELREALAEVVALG